MKRATRPILGTCLAALALAGVAGCRGGDGETPTRAPADAHAAALAKMSPLLHGLMSGTTQETVYGHVETIRELAQANDEAGLRELVQAEQELVHISPSLHPRDQLDRRAPLLTVFVAAQTDVESAKRAVDRLGGTVGVSTATTFVARVPLGAAEALALDPAIRSIQADDLGSLALDLSVPEIGADKVQATGVPAYQTGGLQGEGVIIGIVDTGVDFKHMDLRETAAPNKTRIRRYWDLCNTTPYPAGSGCTPLVIPGSGSQAKECTDVDINAELSVPTSSVLAIDRDGHGTHVAGIAASNGQATGLYAGVAPKADLVVVGDIQRCGSNTAISQVIGDQLSGNFPVYSSASMLFSTDVVAGVDYVFQQARKFGKPAVVNLSAGLKHIGSRDGTSSYETMMDEVSGPGRIVVAASGNTDASNAGLLGHASGNVTPGNSVARPFSLDPDGRQCSVGTDCRSGACDGGLCACTVATETNDCTTPLGKFCNSVGPGGGTGGGPVCSSGARFGFLDLWFSGSDKMCVSVTDSNGKTLGPYGPSTGDSFGCTPAPCGTGTAITFPGGTATLNICFGKDPINGDYEAAIEVNNGAVAFVDKAYVLSVQGTAIATSGRFDVWSANPKNAAFLSGDLSMTLKSPSTAKRVLSIGNYITRTPFFGETLYGLSQGSGRGPSRNPAITGQKVTIAAPGQVIRSAHSADAPAGTACGNCVEPGCQHVENCGTSMAAPHAVGAVALMLEAAPWLTPEDVMDILSTTACHASLGCGGCPPSPLSPYAARRSRAGRHDLKS